MGDKTKSSALPSTKDSISKLNMSKGKKALKNLLRGISDDQCLFCYRSDDDEEQFGKKIQNGLTVHYFCMLFASGLVQRGQSDDQGIYGFLPDDIIKELKRGSRLRCTYCKEKGATIGCVVGKCRHVFHFACGVKNNSMHQYFDTFRSYCHEHRPCQVIPAGEELEKEEESNLTCAICMTSVEMKPSLQTLKTPCCRTGWFHRDCIKRHALAAGLYFFKCPLCNNKEEFQQEMLKYGIYIPDQDAAWELEPNAFNDLLERYLRCDAKLCHCKQGRSYNKDGGKWEILVCDWCGSKGSHVNCHALVRIKKDDYVCQDCMEIHNKCITSPSNKKSKLKSLKTLPSPRANKVSMSDHWENKGKSKYIATGKSMKIRKSLDVATASFHSVMSPPSASSCSTEKLSPYSKALKMAGSALHCVTVPVSASLGTLMVSLPKCSATSTVSSPLQDRGPASNIPILSPVSKTKLMFDSPVSPNLSCTSNRKTLHKKRKRMENEKIRKKMKLDIDMAWSDPEDTLESDHKSTHPIKLRRRNSSFRYFEHKSYSERKTKTSLPLITNTQDLSVDGNKSTAISVDVDFDELKPPDLSPQYPFLVNQRVSYSVEKLDINDNCSQKSNQDKEARKKYIRDQYRRKNPFVGRKNKRRSRGSFTKLKQKNETDEGFDNSVLDTSTSLVTGQMFTKFDEKDRDTSYLDISVLRSSLALRSPHSLHPVNIAENDDCELNNGGYLISSSATCTTTKAESEKSTAEFMYSETALCTVKGSNPDLSAEEVNSSLGMFKKDNSDLFEVKESDSSSMITSVAKKDNSEVFLDREMKAAIITNLDKKEDSDLPGDKETNLSMISSLAETDNSKLLDCKELNCSTISTSNIATEESEFLSSNAKFETSDTFDISQQNTWKLENKKIESEIFNNISTVSYEEYVKDLVTPGNDMQVLEPLKELDEKPFKSLEEKCFQFSKEQPLDALDKYDNLLKYKQYLRSVHNKSDNETKKSNNHKPRVKSGRKQIQGQASITRWFHKSESDSSTDSDTPLRKTKETTSALSTLEYCSFKSESKGKASSSVNDQNSDLNICKTGTKTALNNQTQEGISRKQDKSCVEREKKKIQSSSVEQSSSKPTLRIHRKGRSYLIRRDVMKDITFKENRDKQQLKAEYPEECSRSLIVPLKRLDTNKLGNKVSEKREIKGCTSPHLLKCKVNNAPNSVCWEVSDLCVNDTSSSPTSTDEKEYSEYEQNRSAECRHSFGLDESDLTDLFNSSFSTDPETNYEDPRCVSVHCDSDNEGGESIDVESPLLDSSNQFVVSSFSEGEGFQELKIFVPNQV